MTDVSFTLNQVNNEFTVVPDSSVIPSSVTTSIAANTAAIASANSAITALQALTSHGVVGTSTDQGIDGIKTYSSSPVVPTPVNSNQAATKGYVDGLSGGFTQGQDGRWVLGRAPYSADFTGTTDATSVFQTALNDINTAGGGELVLQPGTLLVSSSLIVYSKTTISGCGMAATVIKLAGSRNVPVMKNFVSPDSTQRNGQFIKLRDFKIDGNKVNNAAGSTNHGIVFTQNPPYTQTTNDIDFDCHNHIENVWIFNCHNNGFHGTGRSEIRLRNVFAYYNDGHNFFGSFDTFYDHCTSGHAGLNGFYWQDSSVRATGCKSFYSGKITVDGTNGNGYAINNGQGGIALAACEAQDNAGNGFALNSSQGAVLVGCIADSNSTPHVNPVSSLGTYCGFDLYNSIDNRIIGCDSYERNAYGGSAQLNAVKLSSGSLRNKIDLTHRAFAFNSAVVGAPVMASSDSVMGNDIDINVQKGTQAIAFSSSITPNFYLGGTVIVGPLTANLTIANPAYSHAGMRITVMFSQDVTGGRTVSWGTLFSPNGWTVTSTSSASSSVTFVHDGTKFQALR